jgi:hypothetical protein
MLTTSQIHSLCVFAMMVLSLFGRTQLHAQFSDVTDDYGLSIYHDIPISESGVSFHDFNRDGLDDLTFAGSGMGVFTFRNTGEGFVQEYYFAGIAGKTLHPIWVDYDNDGDADFFATRAWQCPVLYRNNGDMTFDDVSDAIPCPMDGVISTTATWGDYNSDGFLDVYVANYNQMPSIGDHNWLFRNNGDGTFDEVSDEVGVNYGNFPAFQCMFLDTDFDHDTDLLVVNDKGDGCQFFRNDNGVFTDIANENGFNVQLDAMSLSVSDIDHDGDYDYYISNTLEGNYFLFDENGVFVNRAAEWNATVNANCWGTVFIDTQQKTWEDLYVVSTGPSENLNVLLQNAQGQMFSETAQAFNNEDGEYMYAVAKGDANNDGAYDVLCMPYFSGGSLLFQASGPGSTWLKVALQGTSSNRDGIGATVHCFLNGVDYVRPVTCGENFTSQDSRYLMFGLNGAEAADSIVVQWPSGITSMHPMPAAGQTHLLVEPDINSIQQLSYALFMCPGSGVVLDASEWYVVEWEGGSTDWQLEVFSEGVFTATAWNEQGDQFALEYTVSQLEPTNPELQVQSSLCGGNDASILSGESVGDMWVNGEPYIQGNAELSWGIVNVEWIDTLGCSFTQQLEIPFVEPMLLLAQSDTACFGEEAHYALNAQHAVSPLIWLGVPTATGMMSAGSYSATCIDARGCTAQVSFEIAEREAWEFSLQADTACAASTASASYTWSGAVEPIIQLGEPLNWEAMQPGEYEVEWADAAGCEMETTFEIVAYEPIEWAASVQGASQNTGGQVVLTIEGGLPPYHVLWSNGAQGISLEDAEQGVYSAVITDAAGCSDVTEDWLVPLSIQENEQVEALVYDAKNGLRNRSHQVCEVQIIDSWGRVLIREVLAPGASLSCGHFSRGFYLAVCAQQVLPFAIEH